jgi:DNA polymerase-3 subunit delta
MEYKEVIKQLKSKAYQPVYFLMGEEPFFIDAIADYIAANVLDESERDFNQSVFYGQDVRPDEVVSAAKRFPLMAPYQVIIVKEAQNWKSAEALIPIIEKPIDTTILVICQRGKKLDKRTALWKALTKKKFGFESERIKDYHLTDWITRYCADQGIRINHRAAAMLGDNIGNDLGNLVNALDRLVLLKDDQTEISVDDVATNIGISKDFNIFELRNALGERNMYKSLMIANYFANNPKEHHIIPTIYGLYGHFAQLIRYHYAENKTNDKAVAAAVGVSPYFVKDIRRAAGHYSPKSLMEAMSVLHDIDLKSKGVGTTNANSGELMREMVARLVRL